MRKTALTLAVVLTLPFVTGSAFAMAPLADATEQKNFTTVQGLLQEQDIDVNAVQGDGSTALHWAVYWDNIELARALLAREADV